MADDEPELDFGPPPPYDDEEEVDDPNDLPPPYFPPVLPKPPPEIVKYEDGCKNATPVSDNVAREALLRYIADNECCWGTGPAKECTIETNVWLSVVCTMESFCEYRNCAYEHRPYVKHETRVSKKGDGMQPSPWEMACPPVVNFNDAVEKYDVPFTQSVKRCFECDGRKKVRCEACRGRGRIKCSRCNGDGRTTTYVDGEQREESCSKCNGRGTNDCNFRDCVGRECRDGKITCPKCEGNGQLLKFLEMTRTLETLKNSKTVDSIPDEELDPDLIADAPGATILNATALNISPPSGFSPDVDLALIQIDSEAMKTIMDRHAFLHQERLEIKNVPVSKAEAQMGGEKFHFWVYGSDNRCVCKEEWGYPAQMCCGCTIV